MAVIFNKPYKPTKFERFVDNMSEFPFVRTALFCGLISLFFFFANQDLSMIFISIAGMAIISRLFNAFVFSFISHTLMKISSISMWIGFESLILSCIVNFQLPKFISDGLEVDTSFLFLIPTSILSVAFLFLFMRIFVAFFGEFFQK